MKNKEKLSPLFVNLTVATTEESLSFIVFLEKVI